MTEPGVGAERVHQFVTDGYGGLVGAMTVVCGSRPAAEDAVQEALMRLWVRLDSGHEIVALDRWVATTSLNLLRSRFRRIGRERRAVRRLAASGPPPDRVDSAAAVDVSAAVAALPRRQREVIVLHYFLDLPVDATAAALDVRPGTVKNALFRARKALAVALDVPDAARQEFEDA